MSDAHHLFGGDLAVGPSGDLLSAQGGEAGRQRLLRRLLTNPGDYLWDLEYGAGLGRFVGEPVDVARIEAVIRSQMLREAAVVRQPEPSIEVTPGPGGAVYVSIRYADAAAGGTETVALSLNNG